MYIVVRFFSFYFHPGSLVNSGISILICGFSGYLLLKKNKYGWYIVFGELFLGGIGNFLSISFLSLRTCLLILALLIFFTQNRSMYLANVFGGKNRYLLFTSALFLASVFFSILRGIYFNHPIQLVVGDAIPYLFFFYYFPLVQLFESDQFRNFLVKVVHIHIVGTLTLVVGTFFSFSFRLFNLQDSYYHFFRDVVGGKITDLGSNFFRIVLNEQLLLVPMLLLISYYLIQNEKRENSSKGKILLVWIALLITFSLNFTRIYILALIVGLISCFFYCSWKKCLKYGVLNLVLFFTFFTIFHLTASRGTSLGWELFGLRIQSISTPSTEASSLSRLLLLKPIKAEIMEHPFFGNGLGDSITVFSPVQKKVITTNQFDWGYLEILAEMGFVGFVFWLLFLWQIIKNVSIQQKINFFPAIVGLLVINITSPAVFHVLGITFLTFTLSFAQTNIKV